jgi:tetratricopeptide (TPR) repeat protein
MLSGTMRKGQLDNALRTLNNALRFAPDNTRYLTAKAIVLCDIEEQEEALPIWDRLIKLEPKNALSWDGRALCLMVLKNYPEAQRSAELAVQYGPTNMNYRLTLARVFESEERWPEAEKHLDHILKQLPSSNIARADRCFKVERRLHQWQRVVDDTTYLLKQGTALMTSDNLCCRANAYYQLGRYNESIQDLKRAEKLWPDDMRIQVQLLAVYQKLGDAKTIAEQQIKVNKIQGDFTPPK